MLIKGLIDEDLINYKKPSMTIMMPFCSFKCDKEYGRNVCQNSSLVWQKNINIPDRSIISRYINNDITSAIVFQGLEPFDSFDEMINFIHVLRYEYNCNDDVVIYTGYTEDEIYNNYIKNKLDSYLNIIIKYGRYVPNQKSHFDDVLGINLASNNQYAKKIS